MGGGSSLNGRGRGLGVLLAPAAIAIVGLSADPAKHGGRVLANLRRLGFAGEVWGVNPRRPDVPGVPVVGSLEQSPAVPDLVVCAVPAPAVPDVVRAAGALGAGAAVVFAGGFAEEDEEGWRRQQALATAGAEAGVRILGPNSGGVIRPASGLAVSFLTCLDRPPGEIRSGPVGLVTQSGGTGSYLHNLAAAAGSGLAVSISTGNEADVEIGEAVAAAAELEEVRVVAIVLETVRRGPRFLAGVREAHRRGKPVVACRLGTSRRGALLMQSHTGALARPARVVEGALASLGVTVCETPAEMLDVAEILARAPVPSGGSAGIVTHSGGMAILLADLAERAGVDLPPPDPGLVGRLAPLLDHGSAANPLDMGGIIGGPHRFAEVVGAFLGSDDHDLVLAVSTAHPPAHTRERVESLLALEAGKPLVHLWMGGDQAGEGLARLREAGAPVTEEPRAAIRALAALSRLHELGEAGLPPEVPRVDVAAAAALTESGAKALLAAWGLPVVEGRVAARPEEAAAVADELGYPVVVKVHSPDIAHKSDVGGVRTGVHGPEEAVRAAREVIEAARAASPGARVEGVLVECQRSGAEALVGAVADPVFGPVVVVGLGGVLAEAVDAAAVALAPLSVGEARRLVDRLPGLEALTRPRRGEPADLDALAAVVSRLGTAFAAHHPPLREVEVNPLTWSGGGWQVVDALVRGA